MHLFVKKVTKAKWLKNSDKFSLTGMRKVYTITVLIHIVQLKVSRDDVISLNYRDARPIYEQVKDGLRKLVVSGALQPGEKLPSVRAMASTLAINPNTIQRAYEALEREGYLYSVAGKGSFVAERSDVDTTRQKGLLAQFDAAVSELLYLGVDEQELARRLTEIRKKNEHKEVQP